MRGGRALVAVVATSVVLASCGGAEEIDAWLDVSERAETTSPPGSPRSTATTRLDENPVVVDQTTLPPPPPTSTTTTRPVIESAGAFETSGPGCWARPRINADLMHLADELAHAQPVTGDPITGDPLSVDSNPLLDQLQQGIAVEALVMPTMVSMAVDDQGLRRDLVLILRDDEADRQLAWIEVGPRNPGVKYFQTPAPEIGNDLVVYVVESGQLGPFPDCSEDPPQPLFAVPFDAVAGSQRALLVLINSTYEAYFGP